MVFDAAPYPNTKPGWIMADDVLSDEQKEALQKLYDLQRFKPPVIPSYPKTNSILYMDIARDFEERKLKASSDIAKQAYALFTGKVFESILQMRDSCEYTIWNRVNYHFREAFSHWITYGVAFWCWVDNKK